MSRKLFTGLAVAMLGWCSLAGAQTTTVPNNGLTGATFSPGLPPGVSSPLSGMTPQQLQTYMMMRAMQGRGRHQVHTGVPNPVIDGSYGTGLAPMMSNGPAYA